MERNSVHPSCSLSLTLWRYLLFCYYILFNYQRAEGGRGRRGSDFWSCYERFQNVSVGLGDKSFDIVAKANSLKIKRIAFKFRLVIALQMSLKRPKTAGQLFSDVHVQSFFFFAGQILSF